MNVTPQKLWNNYGLILLIILSFQFVLNCFLVVANLWLKGNRFFLAYRLPELQLLQKINSAELNRNLDRIQPIISQIKGPYGLLVSILLLISSYWALTLCRLYLRRRRGMANHLSLLWRPKFAFSLWIPLAIPAYAYGSWRIQTLSCKDPIILDFFDKVSAVRPVPNLDFNNLRDSLLFAVSLGVLWLFYFGLIKLLGLAATRLEFK